MSTCSFAWMHRYRNMVSEPSSHDPQQWQHRCRQRQQRIGTVLLIMTVFTLVAWEETLKLSIKRRIVNGRQRNQAMMDRERFRVQGSQRAAMLSVTMYRLESGAAEICICVRIARKWKKEVTHSKVILRTMRHVRAVIKTSLLIGCVESNPGPMNVPKPRWIE